MQYHQEAGKVSMPASRLLTRRLQASAGRNYGGSKFYLALNVDGQEVAVAFPQLQPRLHLLRPVCRALLAAVREAGD